MDLLLATHFPNSSFMERGAAYAAACHAKRLDWRLAARIITYGRVEWARDTFAPYKSAGVDGIFPAVLQEFWEVLVSYLVKIFRAWLATGYVPAVWRQIKVVFIHKPGGIRSLDLVTLDASASNRSYSRPWKGWWIDFYGTKSWHFGHFIPINMHTRQESLWKRFFTSSWFGLIRPLINMR
jgi:hypothetical protein